jgi:hypothetical protein
MIADKVNKAIDKFASYLPVISGKFYKQILSILHELTLDEKGNVKINVKNLNTIGKVKTILKKMVKDKRYLRDVNELNGVISDIIQWQTDNFQKGFDDFEEPRVISEYQEQAFQNVKESLTEAGISANVVNKTVDIVKKNINSGANFSDLTAEVKKSMLGDEKVEPRLVSYAKQIVNDTLHGVARNYNALIADMLDLEWYEYTGGLLKDSRPWCIALVGKQFIHKSELKSIVRGDIDGESVSLQGLFPGTDSENVINNCGGYNCEHHMTPISKERVPTAIRRKYEPDVKADDDEKANEGPKRRRK